MTSTRGDEVSHPNTPPSNLLGIYRRHPNSFRKKDTQIVHPRLWHIRNLELNWSRQEAKATLYSLWFKSCCAQDCLLYKMRAAEKYTDSAESRCQPRTVSCLSPLCQWLHPQPSPALKDKTLMSLSFSRAEACSYSFVGKGFSCHKLLKMLQPKPTATSWHKGIFKQHSGMGTQCAKLQRFTVILTLSALNRTKTCNESWRITICSK